MAPSSRSSHGYKGAPIASRRRRLGIYYTPDDLAAVLVRWALAGDDGPILDPSYGGCAFLEAAAEVLAEVDPFRVGTRVYGVDIDPDCVDTVRCSRRLVDANCTQGDFLATSPDDLRGGPFAAIVGNPPYVRHHWIRGPQRASARGVVDASTIPLPATASLWAYFVLHSLGFLARGGRLAMLVPEAIFQARYAGPLRKALSDRFARSRLIHVRARLFDHTDEAVVALTCSGFGERGDIEALAVESVADLQSALMDLGSREASSGTFPFAGNGIDPGVVTLLNRIRDTPAVKPLGEVATVRVGLVTGANRHFIRSRQRLDAMGMPSHVRHAILSRAKWLNGLEFTRHDHETLAGEDRAAFLVRPNSADDDRVVESWIREGARRGIADRYKCRLRKDWFRVDMPTAPDAFATCARAGSPQLVLNRAGFPNSNAVHSVRWTPALAVAPEAVVVGFLTSAVSAWAELHGRRYGGGVLKLEPGTLQRVPIPMVSGAADAFEDLDRLMRAGREDEARRIADDRVLREGLGLGRQEITSLQRARMSMMEWRRPPRKSNGHG